MTQRLDLKDEKLLDAEKKFLDFVDEMRGNV